MTDPRAPSDCAVSVQISAPHITHTVHRKLLRVPYPANATFTIQSLALHFGVSPKRMRNVLSKHRRHLGPFLRHPLRRRERVIPYEDFLYLCNHAFYLVTVKKN